jgi:hypothetical protein
MPFAQPKGFFGKIIRVALAASGREPAAAVRPPVIA